MRRRATEFRKTADAMADIVRHIRRGDEVSRMSCSVRLSGEPGERDSKRWYFGAASGDRDGFRTDQVCCGNDEAFAVEMRERLRFALIAGKPIVIHDFDDELEMACWAEAI